ncbi:unnamed protein product [Oreochromis niloticus]|nr:unnamed protein product [Mustela putorius furo]
MDQCEDREEGVPPSKSTLCGEHESQTKAQRNPPGPPPSSVSLQSDWSEDRPIHFKVQQGFAAERIKGRPTKPPPSCVSLQSDWSEDRPIHFKVQQASAAERVEPAGDRWLRPGLRKYSCQLTIDTNTVNTKLQLSDNNRKVTRVKEVQSYPDHPDRFDYWEQLLCSNGLTGRCYWEVEWRGNVYISVSYRSIRRKGDREEYLFGCNDQSWSLSCSDDGPLTVWYNNRQMPVTSSSSSSVSNRVAVYVDCPAGTLSFYRVSSDTLIHLHTFNTTFTQTLYPGFRVGYGSSVSLC